jgi:ABC-type glycerol-3-phosphate transport system substrate-binding protein
MASIPYIGRMKKIIATTIVGSAALLLLAGCAGDAQDIEYIGTATPTPSSTSTPSPTPTPAPTPSESPTPTPVEPDNI